MYALAFAFSTALRSATQRPALLGAQRYRGPGATQGLMQHRQQSGVWAGPQLAWCALVLELSAQGANSQGALELQRFNLRLGGAKPGKPTPVYLLA